MGILIVIKCDRSTSGVCAGATHQHVELLCHEIHAGGFRSIEDHHFQKTENYLRRAQSFNNPNPNPNYDSRLNLNMEQSISNDCDTFGKHQRKISLNEYANIRAKSSEVSTPQPFNFNSYPNSVTSGEGNVNEEASAIKSGKFCWTFGLFFLSLFFLSKYLTLYFTPP